MLKKIKNRLNNNKGFTLVEVMVAATIVVIVSVMLVYAFLGAASINKKANEIKETGREFDNDIHMGVDSTLPVENVNFVVKKGDQILEIGGTPFQLPMNIYTFKDENTGGRQMMVFRNPTTP